MGCGKSEMVNIMNVAKKLYKLNPFGDIFPSKINEWKYIMGIFNQKRAAQVVAYFANKCPNRTINYMKAIKLVYLADRKSISRSLNPILSDDLRYSMKHGAVNSVTLDLLKRNKSANVKGFDVWAQYISEPKDYEIISTEVRVSDLDELSNFDIKCLKETWEEFGKLDHFQIEKWMHENLEEWENITSGRKPISLRSIYKALKIKDTDSHQEEMNSLHSALRTLDALGLF